MSLASMVARARLYLRSEATANGGLRDTGRQDQRSDNMMWCVAGMAIWPLRGENSESLARLLPFFERLGGNFR
jgi:hypothetical protein